MLVSVRVDTRVLVDIRLNARIARHLQEHVETTVGKQRSQPALVHVRVAVALGIDLTGREFQPTVGKRASVVGLVGGSLHLYFFGLERALMKPLGGRLSQPSVDREV